MTFVRPLIPDSDVNIPVFNLKSYGAVGNGVHDDTAAITAMINAINAATYGGVGEVPPGNYLTTGAHPALGPKSHLEGAGVTSSTFTHTGNNVLFTETAPGVTNERIGITGILIVGNSGAVAKGIEIRDVNYGAYLEHVRVTNYTGAAGTALLLHNFAALQFTEGVQLDDFSSSNCTIGIDFYRTSGTESFNGTLMKNVAINVPNNGTAISVGARAGSGAVWVYNSNLANVQIWFDGHTNNFGIDVGNSSIIRDTFVWVKGEGASGSTTVIRVQAGSFFVHTGYIQLGDNVTWTLTGTYWRLGNQPQELGGNAGGIPGTVFVGPRGLPARGKIATFTPYNNTTPYLPGTPVIGFTKEGYIGPFSGQANAELRLGVAPYGNRFISRDSNTVDWLAAGDSFADAILDTIPALCDTSNAVIASAALRLHLVGPVKRSGFLRDLSAYIVVTSGNIELSVWDTGEAAGSATILTKLYASGLFSSGAGGAWATNDPGGAAVPCTPGQYFYLGIQADNGTVTAQRTLGGSASAQYPATFPALPGTAKLGWAQQINATAGSLPATVTPSTVSSTRFKLAARIA